MEKLEDIEFDDLFKDYSGKPIDMHGTPAYHFTLGDEPIIITKDGEQLFKERPYLFQEVLYRKPREDKSLVNEGQHGRVFRVGETLAEKRFKDWRERGTEQIRDLALIDSWSVNKQKIRALKTYYASGDILLMEYIGAPTWSKIVEGNHGMSDVLQREFHKNGGKKIQRNSYVSFESRFVIPDSDGGYSFVLGDPEILNHGLTPICSGIAEKKMTVMDS
jgi:hypothetical protein